MRFAHAVGMAVLAAGCSKELPGVQDVRVAPQVTILSPEDGTEALEGSTVVFVAMAEDDGAMGDLSVEWSSDVDGVLVSDEIVDSDGKSQLSIASLTPGFHAVSIRVADREEGSAQDSV